MNAINRAFQGGRTGRQGEVRRHINGASRDVLSIGHVPVINLHRNRRVEIVAAADREARLDLLRYQLTELTADVSTAPVVRDEPAALPARQDPSEMIAVE